MAIQQWSERIWIAQLADEPALSDDLTAMRERAEASARMPDVVLDFSGVRQINSSNLSQMLRLRKLAIDRGGRVRVVNPSNGIWGVFISTGLDKVFEFTQDVATALAQLQMGQQGG